VIKIPYIKQEDRPLMNLVVKAMADADVRANGDLNYILFTFCKRHIDLNYNSLKNYIGELRQCATEIERRILGPYEDEKIKINKDIN
jgi:hypothetical protein